MVVESDGALRDYFAKLNLEGGRKVWVKNRGKISYVYCKVEKLLKNAVYVCEVGVGEGYLLRLLHNRGFDVVGVDLSKYVVGELQRRFDREGLDIKLIHADISKVDLGEDRFSAFFCFDVLEHVPNVKEAIGNIKKGLVNGGLLVGTLPYRENLGESMVICPRCEFKFHSMGHRHSFGSFKEIRELLGSDWEMVEMGEVLAFKTKIDVVSNIIKKISERILREKKGLSTVYFVARAKKDNFSIDS